MKTETFIVAGTSYYEDNIRALLAEAEDFKLPKKDLLESYSVNDIVPEFYPVTDHVVLEEEPDNKYDPNAIKVIMFNSTVGYIKKGSCSHVKKLLQEKDIKVVATEVHAGRYKKILEDTVETDSFKAPFIRIAISYGESLEEPVPEKAAAAPRTPEPEPKTSERAKKLKKTKIRLSIVAVIAWIILSALCHLIDPAIVLGIIFIIVISELFKRFK